VIEAKNKYKTKKNLEADLKANYASALKDRFFNKIIHDERIVDEVGMKYTSRLEESAECLKTCSSCPGLHACKMSVNGHYSYPKLEDKRLIFSYVECTYMKEEKIKAQNKQTNINSLDNASMKSIDITDKKRVKVIKWLKDFYDNYESNNKCKGLFLHGNFGCGKTYLISALFNELSKKRVRCHIEYFPELLRTLKDDWDKMGAKMDYLCEVDLLLIDDIGAEKVSEWGRDEVLGTILQARMNNELTTFFTSNLDIEELEKHLSTSRESQDSVKARRIIERIKHLSEQIEMLSENRRK